MMVGTRLLLLLLLLVIGLATATLPAALRVAARTADNCFSRDHGDDDVLHELSYLLPASADERTVSRALYALVGALRAGRPLCSAVVSAAGTRMDAMSAVDACRSRLGAARGALTFTSMDALLMCLKTGYQRGALLALVQSQDEEDARSANAAAAAASS